MLHYETVDSKTLELLRELMKVDIFKNLRLVGGTSLALQFGHRKSIDLDLFGSIDADIYEIENVINKYEDVQKIQMTKNIHIWIVNGIKVDIVNYPYPWIGELILADGLRLADTVDISAMKLAAITGRGSKKDYYDLFYLLNLRSLKEILSFYEMKFKDGSIFMVLKSLIYFDDADQDIMPVLLKDLPWEKVKDRIRKVYHEFIGGGN